MNAQVQIDRLLLRLTPIMHPESLVLCTVDASQLPQILDDCLCVFREQEGVCVLLPQSAAQAQGLEAGDGFRQITLQFPHNVTVPGLAAKVIGELAEAGLFANVVSARCHEHILVREQDARLAMQVLHGISNRLHYS